MNEAIAVAMTGASGACYGLRLVQCLLEAGRTVQLMISRPGQVVINMETDLELPADSEGIREALLRHFGLDEGPLQVFGRQQWLAPVASGTNPPRAMVICPCTTGTLASVANGICDDLIDRAADVALKERRPLILVVRETPYSAIHLENMLRLTRAGATILPANPGFYFRPRRIDDLVDFVVARILDHLQVPHRLGERWGADPAADI
ncbi:MAG TPA: UbiX family flavin prenyltransferase [Gammaproteobacteria bacterium]|nr:UbiX family flavin prenyltransferase [Gammaproteobacteria bacterium]